MHQPTTDDLIRYLRQQQTWHGSTLYVDRDVEPLVVGASEPVIDVVERHAEAPQAERTPPTEEMTMHAWETAATLDDLHHQIKGCEQCALGFTRTNFVFGSGNPDADVMVIGEAPGADEDAQGLPFVGRAGQLLTKILEAIDLPRDQVYICNILKCRPPNNRKPLVTETDECEPYLWKQIELVRPRYILALGLTAANTLLKNKESMTALRGRIHDYHGIATIVTYHPAALLRNPEWKKHTWDDVRKLQALLREPA